MTLRFPFWYLYSSNAFIAWWILHFRGKNCPKMCLKINRSVKTPWHSPSMGVARSGLWAPENSQHFAMPPLIFQRNDVWRTNAEVPCWWHVTTLTFWLVEANFQPIHRENSGGVATCRLFTQDKRAYWEGELISHFRVPSSLYIKTRLL